MCLEDQPVSHYELRDISDRLARSKDAEAVAQEFLGALQTAHPTWHSTLAFYEISRDALVKLYEREREQFRSRDIKVMVDQLPARMIRNFFHPNAAIEPHGRHAPPGGVQTPPMFEPDLNDAVLLRALLPVATWQSAICLPLSDRGEMLAVLTIVSPKKGAFGPATLEEIAPLKSMAAFALAERLHLATHAAIEPDPDAARRAAAEFQERVEQLSIHARELEEASESKDAEMRRLTQQLSGLDKHSNEYLDELQRVKAALEGLEARSSLASLGLSEASAQLELAREQLGRQRRTQDFLRQVFDSLAEEHDPRRFPGKVVGWLTEQFEVERCSVMLIDRSGYLMRIAEQEGIPADVAERVRVRVGQGVSGWVAQHRKPLFVRQPDDAPPDVSRNKNETYRSESFICVPIIFNGRCTGVLNLTNRKDGTAFNDADLDRAMLAAGVFAITLGANEAVRRALAWAA